MAKHGLIGLVLIFSSILSGKFLTDTILTEFLIEGLSIGGWVLFWELFSNLFFSSSEMRETKGILERLKKSKINYEYRLKKVY